VIWRRGEWLGFQGKDLDVEIVMDTLKVLRSVSVGFLQDVRPWIVYPSSMHVETSPDGINWTSVGSAQPPAPVTDMSAQTTTLTVNFSPVRARHVRIRATNFGPLPAWHPGAGGQAYVFCDEVQLR